MSTIPVIDMTATETNIKRQRGETMPTVDKLFVLAAAFRVTVDEILVCQRRFQILITA